MLVKLKDLVPGGDIDSRSKAGQQESVDSLMNSIAQLGLIEPLVVAKQNDKYVVIDGNRRLKALKRLHKKANGLEVEVTLKDVGFADAAAMSLAANIERLDLHPVDQYEAFDKLHNEGLEVPDIAAKFGISERLVRQRIALGALCPEAREAWRNGGMNAELAQLLTRLDKEAQLKLLLTGESGWKLAQTIRSLTENNKISPTSGIARFVGLDRYLASGGTVAKDLFTEEGKELWNDAAIAGDIANARLNDLREEVLKDGWSFFEITDEYVGQNFKVEDGSELAEEDRLELERLNGRTAEIENSDSEDDYSQAELDELHLIEEQIYAIEERRHYSAEQLARCGVVVDPHYQVHYGCERRGPKKEKVDEQAGEDKPKEKPLSSTLVMDLDGHLTHALHGALVDSPRTAVRLLALSFLTDYYLFEQLATGYVGVGIRADFSGKALPASDYGLDHVTAMVKASGLFKAKNLDDQMKCMMKIGDEGINEILAFVIGRSLNTRHRGSALTLHLDKMKLLDIGRHYTPTIEDFFSRLTKAQLMMLLPECTVEIREASEMKKSELANAIAEHLPKGWVPEAIRPKKPE